MLRKAASRRALTNQRENAVDRISHTPLLSPLWSAACDGRSTDSGRGVGAVSAWHGQQVTGRGGSVATTDCTVGLTSIWSYS